MSLPMLDQKQQLFVKSELEFQRAKSKGLREIVQGWLKRTSPYLVAFEHLTDIHSGANCRQVGLQEIAIAQISGSVSRTQDFTRQFAPRFSHDQTKESWRNIYTLVVSGVGLSPIELYQVGDTYVVQDGHKRLSVAAYCGWPTIQANVTCVPNSMS